MIVEVPSTVPDARTLTRAASSAQPSLGRALSIDISAWGIPWSGDRSVRSRILSSIPGFSPRDASSSLPSRCDN